MKKKSNPLWGGRFKSNSSALLKKINNSISFDYKLAKQDLEVSKAYCKALLKSDIISKSESLKILKGLNSIARDISSNNLVFSNEYEDIHMNIEMELNRRIGDIAGKIHTGRSRNDQVSTDLKMWVKEKSEIIKNLLNIFQKVLINKSEENIKTIMPGFTHLQNAQPISLAHYFMAFFEMFQRDITRIVDSLNRINECPLGSGALAGTNFSNIDRDFLAKELGFKKKTENSLDSVSDRDYGLDFLFNLSIISMHFSRMAEDFIIWCTSGFSFISFPESFCTGSSIMPQKRNPDAAELIRSKTARVYGNLTSLFITLKGLPMAYSKDLQEDKEPIFEAYETIELIILVMTEIVKGLKINKNEMYMASDLGFSTATDFADWIVQNLNYPFRKAHEITGKIVLLAEKKMCKLRELDIKEIQKIEPGITFDIFSYISIDKSVENKKSSGGTSFQQIKKAIIRAKRKVNAN